jgi:hypothetical protein
MPKKWKMRGHAAARPGLSLEFWSFEFVSNFVLWQDFSFLKKAAIFLNISLLSKASAEIPPFPPLKKGGGGGI